MAQEYCSVNIGRELKKQLVLEEFGVCDFSLLSPNRISLTEEPGDLIIISVSVDLAIV